MESATSKITLLEGPDGGAPVITNEDLIRIEKARIILDNGLDEPAGLLRPVLMPAGMIDEIDLLCAGQYVSASQFLIFKLRDWMKASKTGVKCESERGPVQDSEWLEEILTGIVEYVAPNLAKDIVNQIYTNLIADRVILADKGELPNRGPVTARIFFDLPSLKGCRDHIYDDLKPTG